MQLNQVRRTDIPAGSILAASRPSDEATRKETHLDCFSAEMEGQWTLEQFVEIFYKTWLFRTERVILKYVMRLPSTDDDLGALLSGDRQKFAAWSLEQRNDNELLMCDIASKTKSWFMVKPVNAAGESRTVVHFGTVVVATPDRQTGEPRLGTAFRLFMPLHLLYGRSLLRVAVRDMRRTRQTIG